MPITSESDSTYRREQAVSVIRDSDWWGSFGDQFGWKLHSFTKRDFAHFTTSSRGLLRLTADQKADIERRIARG